MICSCRMKKLKLVSHCTSLELEEIRREERNVRVNLKAHSEFIYDNQPKIKSKRTKETSTLTEGLLLPRKRNVRYNMTKGKSNYDSVVTEGRKHKLEAIAKLDHSFNKKYLLV